MGPRVMTQHPRAVAGTENTPPLLALVYCRAILAIENWRVDLLRGMSLRDAMSFVGEMEAPEVVAALRAIDDLSVSEAVAFHDACRKVADATDTLSLIVEPRAPAR